ncbi:MAG TPA: OsmC family peroxiredoxin [Gaiellaceae bacterium]|jgi:osmotically inducible protein OsmC
MAVEHRAHTTWEGDLQNGSGVFTLGSGVTGPQQVTWKARAEDASAGTSPEELIAAALSSCFSMALSAGLARAGTPPTKLDTDVVSSFEGGVGLTKLAVTVRGQVEGVDENAFREAAESAKENCPVSKALKGNVEITLDASLA